MQPGNDVGMVLQEEVTMTRARRIAHGHEDVMSFLPAQLIFDLFTANVADCNAVQKDAPACSGNSYRSTNRAHLRRRLPQNVMKC